MTLPVPLSGPSVPGHGDPRGPADAPAPRLPPALLRQRLQVSYVNVTQPIDAKFNTRAAFRIPGTEVTLKKGDMLYINVTGIHYDERFYPNPTEFNPDNFSKEGKAKRSP